jgi:hypothetical protein
VEACGSVSVRVSTYVRDDDISIRVLDTFVWADLSSSLLDYVALRSALFCRSVCESIYDAINREKATQRD